MRMRNVQITNVCVLQNVHSSYIAMLIRFHYNYWKTGLMIDMLLVIEELLGKFRQTGEDAKYPSDSLFHYCEYEEMSPGYRSIAELVHLVELPHSDLVTSLIFCQGCLAYFYDPSSILQAIAP